MLPFDPADLSTAALVAIFVAAGVLVWLAGSRLSGYVEAISERTGLGAAFMGAVLLGGITSLPELATTLTAAIGGDADMAVNNIYGGVAMQVAVLALADAAIREESLSSVARKPVILLEGILLIFVLALSTAGMIIGEPAGWPVGPWAASTLLAALGAFYVIRRYEGHPAWQPVTEEGRLEEAGGRRERDHAREGAAPDDEGTPEPEEPDDPRRSLATLIALSALAGLAILAAGVVLTRTGETLATRTGLGSSFVGAALIAASTSMPEVSTTIAAARLGRYDMAFSNVFGANLLDIGLIAVTDIAYQGPPVLLEMGRFAQVGALLGIGVTALFLAGVIRRRVPKLGRLGVDSIAVLALYLAGLYALFTLR